MLKRKETLNSEEQRQMQRPACPTTPSHFTSPNIGRFQGKSASVYTEYRHIQLDNTTEKQTRHRILKLKLQVSIRVEAETGK